MLYFTGSKTFDAQILVGTTSIAGNGGLMHLAKPPRQSSKLWPKDYIANVTLSASHVSVGADTKIEKSEASNAVESYPTHNMLPIMIYIGKCNSNGGGGGGGGGDSKYTKLFSSSKTW